MSEKKEAEKKTFELKQKVALSSDSQLLLDKFLSTYKDKKEVDTHDVYLLLAKAAGMMAVMTFDDGKLLNENAQRQLLIQIYDQLCREEANDFEQDPRIEEILDMIFDMKKGKFEVNLGKKGMGCFPCCGTVKVTVHE